MHWAFIRRLSSVILCWIVVESLAKQRSLIETQCGMTTSKSCHQYKELGIFDLTCKHVFFRRVCDQVCNHAKCKLSCASGVECNQTCIAGRCKDMKCKSKKCSQKCLRSACTMSCIGDECRQSCDLAGCTMKCPPGVKVCVQKWLNCTIVSNTS